MSLNSIEQVKAAEQKAEEAVSSANSEAASIISAAKKNAESIIADAGKAARAEGEDSISEARKKNAALFETLTAELDAEMKALRNSAMKNASEAAALIHKALA